MNLTAGYFPLEKGSRDPECDPARLLEARGYSGVVTVIEGTAGRPRTTVNIEKAAKLKTEEGPNAPRFVKYRGTVGAGSYRREENWRDSSTLIATSSKI